MSIFFPLFLEFDCRQLPAAFNYWSGTGLIDYDIPQPVNYPLLIIKKSRPISSIDRTGVLYTSAVPPNFILMNALCRVLTYTLCCNVQLRLPYSLIASGFGLPSRAHSPDFPLPQSHRLRLSEMFQKDTSPDQRFL